MNPPVSDTPQHSGTNQRLSERIEIHEPAELRMAGGVVLRGTTRNISPQGAFLECAQALQAALRPGTRAQLVFQLAIGAVTLESQVAHTRPDGIGLQVFLDSRDQVGYGILSYFLRNPKEVRLPFC